jgi:hypothetical protein
MLERRKKRNTNTMSSRTFTYLIFVALGIAMLGLGANLRHLHGLMQGKDEPHLLHPFNQNGGYYSNSPMTSSRSATRGLLQDHLQTETKLFARLLKESVAAIDQCPTGAAAPTQPSRRLGRFGFMKALNNHLAIAAPEPAASSVVAVAVAQKQQQCYNAPLTACHVSKYSMLVTSDGQNLRTLFLNLLSWLTFPDVSQIVVLLPPQSNATLQDDAKYGQRLHTWHADDTHKVSLEFVTTLWKFDTALDEEAVVLMNANVPDKSNHRGLETGLELWKRHADTVVASQGWRVIKQQQQQAVVTAASSQPFCKHETATMVIRSKNEIQIADLHYLVVHRNYLCFLSHSILTNLHRFTTNLQEERLSISILLTQLSGQVPRLFPSRVRASKQRKLLLREQQNALPSSLVSLLRGDKQTIIALPLNRRLSSSSTHVDSRLSAQKNEDLVDNDFVTSVAGFFGSLPTESISWCKDCMEDDEVSQKIIPWMATGETCKPKSRSAAQ